MTLAGPQSQSISSDMKICPKCNDRFSISGIVNCPRCCIPLVGEAELSKLISAPTVAPKQSFSQTVKSFSPQVKAAMIAGAVTVILFFVGLALQYLHSVTELADSRKEVASLKGVLADTKAERDKAQVELAPWVQLANTQFTNTPLNKRLDELFNALRTNLEAHTKAVPGLPFITISTMDGLPTDRTNNDHLRLNQLVVRNLNDVEIDNFCARLQLPEPILETTATNQTVGTLVGWRPLLLKLLTTGTAGRSPGGMWIGPTSAVFFVYPDECFFPKDAQGRGQQTEHSGAGNVTGVWELTIDKLPPFGHVSIEFLTHNTTEATNYIRFANTPLCQLPPVSRPDTNELKFYLEGEYWYPGNIKPGKQHLLVPISFDPNQRKFSSLGVQADLGRWHPTLMNLY
jgi:hypothetical protein